MCRYKRGLIKGAKKTPVRAGRRDRPYERVVRTGLNSPMLVVPATRRSTLGDRAFPVSAARAGNALPPTVRAASIVNLLVPVSAQSLTSSCFFYMTDSAVVSR